MENNFEENKYYIQFCDGIFKETKIINKEFMTARTLANVFGHIYRIIGHHALDACEIHIDTHLCPMTEAQTKCGKIYWYPHNKVINNKTVIVHLYAPSDVLTIEGIYNYMDGIKVIIFTNINIKIDEVEGDITVEECNE